MTDPAARSTTKGPASRRTERPHDAPTAAVVRRRAMRRLVLLAVLLVALSVAAPFIQQVSPTKSYAVASDSMEPLFRKGSLVVAADEPVETGDIVVYWSPLGEFQVHRIVETIHADDGEVMYRTAGDANAAEDSFLVPAADVQGKVVRHAPHVGYLWILPDWVQHVAFWGALVVYLGFTAWEARALLPKRPRIGGRGGALLLVLLLSAPAMGAVGAAQPVSAQSVGVGPTHLPLASGISGTSEVSNDRNGASVTVPFPRLWKEVPMWNCKKEAFCTNPLSPGDSEEIGSLVRIDMAEYAPAPTFYFEAYVAAPAGHSAQVHLYDTTDNVEVAGSRVTTTSPNLTLLRSEPFFLSGAKDYTIRSGHSGTGQGGTIAASRLLLVQDHPTKTVEQIRVSQGTEEGSTTWEVPARATKWRFDGAATDGIAAARFEIVAEVDGDMLTDSHVRLMDRTAGTVVSSLRVGVLDTAPKRFVSTDIRAALVDGHEYEIEVKRGDGLLWNRLHLYVARVHIAQSGFDTTVRYVDLSWKATTTETTFIVEGTPGRYQMETEWGGREGYFEVTMRNSEAAGTSTAELYDATKAAPVTGSTTTTTGTTLTRVRSGAVDLGQDAATYVMRLKADAGTAEVRQAWLIVHQGPGKVHDHVLSATAESSSCRWAVSVHYIASKDLSRLRHATVTLRGETRQDQLRVEDGNVVQASGTPITTENVLRVDHLVSTDPSASGLTTIDTEQRSVCIGTGIRMMQAIRYTFE